jgi:hypothetical protein
MASRKKQFSNFFKFGAVVVLFVIGQQIGLFLYRYFFVKEGFNSCPTGCIPDPNAIVKITAAAKAPTTTTTVATSTNKGSATTAMAAAPTAATKDTATSKK